MDRIKSIQKFGEVFNLRSNQSKQPVKNCIYVDANSIVEGEHAYKPFI